MRHANRQLPALTLAILCALAACEPRAVDRGPNPTPEPQPEPVARAPRPDPVLPDVSGKPGAPKVPFEGDVHRPALSKMAAGETFDLKTYADDESCAECHGEIAAEWRDSMHAWASLSNGLYRASFDDFKAARGADKTKFCAGCHDVALLMDDALEPASDPASPASHAGISCIGCHGVTDFVPRGNGSYTLSTKPLPVPIDGDDKSLAAHKAAAAKPSLTADGFCVTCHRGVLTPESGHEAVLPGLDEFGPWRRSPYAGKQTARPDDGVREQDCTSCHMPQVGAGEAKHASHRFPGGHTAFATTIGSPAQLDAQRKLIEGSVTVDVFRRPSGDGEVVFDVVVFNERVGHNFPAGARDLRDTWLEVRLTDASGATLAHDGATHEADADPDSAHVFHARQFSADGEEQTGHSVSDFRTAVFDHTIAPRDAAVVRFAWRPESMPDGPLTVSARVRHRRLTRPLAQRACDESKTKLGARWADGAARERGARPDPCAPQPVLEVASLTRPLDATPEAWSAWYRYGVGLQHHVQENLNETMDTFEQAQTRLPADARPRDRAAVLIELARVTARQGRTKEAVALYEQADDLLPNHPAIWYGVGEAHMRVWAFEEAAKAYWRVAEAADDSRIWRRLAIAEGSAGRPRYALEAAHRGLAREPRDPHMLRSQMLSYRALDTPEEWKKLAAETFSYYQRDTKAPHVRDLCSAKDPACRRERTPVHTHVMTDGAP
jgi:hypothetical protein